MATHQRNERTLKLRKLAELAPRLRMKSTPEIHPAYSFEDAEEQTRPVIDREMAPPSPRSIPQQMGDQWSGVPTWAKVAAIVVPIIATAVVQIIQALK